MTHLKNWNDHLEAFIGQAQNSSNTSSEIRNTIVSRIATNLHPFFDSIKKHPSSYKELLEEIRSYTKDAISPSVALKKLINLDPSQCKSFLDYVKKFLNHLERAQRILTEDETLILTIISDQIDNDPRIPIQSWSSEEKPIGAAKKWAFVYGNTISFTNQTKPKWDKNKRQQRSWNKPKEQKENKETKDYKAKSYQLKGKTEEKKDSKALLATQQITWQTNKNKTKILMFSQNQIEAEALIDAGSSHNFVEYQHATQIGAKVKRFATPIKIQSLNTLSSYDQYIEAEISFVGKKQRMQFIVMDETPYHRIICGDPVI